MVPESKYYLRADQFVFRINPEETNTIDYYATHLGNRLPNTALIAELQPALLSAQPGTPTTSVPETTLSFNKEFSTDENGKATIGHNWKQSI